MATIAVLEDLLTRGQDNALLRFSLGNAYLQANDAAQAIVHLRQALVYDPDYSAAWKLLGKALTLDGQTAEALSAYTQGIEVAARRGDKQAEKEMQVFKKRLEQHAD
ncbi:tetratricopeptide repeat protein [Thiorhodospira sibirica]|uniref:tetratricopeptide repeat protein n=1 Tax=Thiorhodospira sibirica TaxID=154347 RepID=UPI00022C177C|nr:tetratricopeptide repeat protein [Thiorhodospira sibirica]